jgi:hypothetical protein
LDAYTKITSSDKKICDHSMPLITRAAKGIYIDHKHMSKKGKKDKMCLAIKEAKENNDYPIVHDDSLTTWCNIAAEKHGLKVKDILKMKKGQQMKVILIDRNVGDYLHGTKVGEQFNPKKKGLNYGTYIHNKGLTGKLTFDQIEVVHNPFVWEINAKALSKNNYFWSPICLTNGINEKNYLEKLDKNIYVGWRGPSIRSSDTKYLPKKVTHYGTWWDDYAPLRYHNYLKKK